MAKNTLRIMIFTLFTCFGLLHAPEALFGAGGRDADIIKADQLIDDKEYDEAILVLTEFAKRNPNKFDLAQTRLNRIYLLREEFNKTADILIETILNDPGNDERILELTILLRSLENENSPVLVNFLSRLHDIALFNVARNQLRDILERGRNFLNRNDYEAAFQTYVSGMSIFQEEFYSYNFGTAVHNQARQETQRINAVVANFSATSSQFESIVQELTRAVNQGQHARVPEIMTRLSVVMDRFIEQKMQLYSSLSALDRVLRDLQRADPEMGDRNHLAFIIRVIQGRDSQDIQEGMLGVFDQFWLRTTMPAFLAINQYIDTSNSNGLTSFSRRDYSASINHLSGIPLYATVTPVFFEKHKALKPYSNTVSFNNETILNEDFFQFLQILSLNGASTAINNAAATYLSGEIDRSSLQNYRNRTISAPHAFATEQNTRETINRFIREIREIRNDAVQLDSRIAQHQNLIHIRNAVSALDALLTQLQTEEQQSAQRFYNLAQADLEYNLAERKKVIEIANDLLEGQRRTTEDGVIVVYRFPAEALLELTPMLSATEEDVRRANTLMTQLRNEPPGVASNNEIRNLQNRYQAAITELTALQTRGTQMAQTAAANSSRANALRQDGERFFAEAQAAFRRQDFDRATEQLENASRRLDESLALQESSELREYRNTQIIGLGQQIAMAQNETIIVQVRQLVNTARDQYFAGNFQQAEDNLLRARSRWRLVNHTEENAEVIYWLNMVQRAMSTSSARTVPVTAPLYPEVSQLLSEARINYEEGMRLINAGQRAQGIERFDAARIKTREVKLMFPVNQEAGILELRMEQFTDPAAFNADFERRLQTAIAGTRRRSLEAYGDLLNLAEINPRYPGIRNIITQAEIDMGIRPPPPNPADVARSNQLTASARRILDQRLVDEFPNALEQINTAITLNPLNTDAPRVKDRLLNSMNTTETSAVVLSSEDEERYRLAVSALQAGNNLVAYAHVERIMQNPRNRNVPKVVELQRRIQAAL